MTTSEAPTIQQILTGSNAKELRAFFAFDKNDDSRKVLFKFNLWARYFFPQYFTSPDAPFHADMDANNLAVYRGALKSFVNIAFRGGAKTARTKLFIAFVVANDMDQTRRYFKILSADKQNATQIVTDIFNSLVYPRVAFLYPELFQRTNQKREETMSSFTTATGIKIIADSVGTDQRGAIMEDARPDFLWLEDFENRTTLRSAKKTKAIADNIEEARTGLAKDGGAVFTCNYISEAGNVHQLVIKPGAFKCVQITPIIANGLSTWATRYTLADIDYMRETDDDFEGERLCLKPGTCIVTSCGLKEIQTLKVGDLVLTHKNRFQRIARVFESQAEGLLDITINNKTITITKNHPVLVLKNLKQVWVKAGGLLVSDLLLELPHSIL